MGLLGMSQRNECVVLVFRCLHVGSHVGSTEWVYAERYAHWATEMSELICEIKGFKLALKPNFPAVVCTKFAYNHLEFSHQDFWCLKSLCDADINISVVLVRVSFSFVNSYFLSVKRGSGSLCVKVSLVPLMHRDTGLKMIFWNYYYFLEAASLVSYSEF